MIEDAKSILRTWGARDPNFLLCNSKLTFQMTMIPEKTQYLTQGPDGVRRLKDGPSINTYRGLKIINSRSFSMEDGAPPRDVLRRRVRVAEYYRIPYEEGIEDKYFSFYDESKDAWQKYSWHDLFSMANIGDINDENHDYSKGGRVSFGEDDINYDDDYENGDAYIGKRYKKIPTNLPKYSSRKPVDFKLSKDLWKDMNEKNFQGYTSGAPATIQDPVNSLLALLPGKQNKILKAIVSYDEKAKQNVRKACGFSVEFTKDTEPGYALAFNDYRNTFSRFLKEWLLGNTVPHEVHVFLEQFNWQGFKDDKGDMEDEVNRIKIFEKLIEAVYPKLSGITAEIEVITQDKWELVIIRPNIEHNMLGIVLGCGGLEELGATFWGQTELSCFDDSMHGEHR